MITAKIKLSKLSSDRSSSFVTDGVNFASQLYIPTTKIISPPAADGQFRFQKFSRISISEIYKRMLSVGSMFYIFQTVIKFVII